MKTEKPEGFMEDSQGRLVPLSMVTMVSDLDKLRDQTVRGITQKALRMRDALAAFKADIRDELTAYLTLSAEQYDKKYGGKKGNVTLTSYDGRMRLMLAIDETIVFDERLQIAKRIIDERITRWSDGSRDEIKALVADAFYVDKMGRINTQRILGLRRLAIKDDDESNQRLDPGVGKQGVSTGVHPGGQRRIPDGAAGRRGVVIKA